MSIIPANALSLPGAKQLGISKAKLEAMHGRLSATGYVSFVTDRCRSRCIVFGFAGAGIERSKSKRRAVGGRLVTPSWGAPALALIEQEAEPDDFAARGIPAICWRDDVPPLFEPFQLRENTDYFIDVTLPLSRWQPKRSLGEAGRGLSASG